MKTEKQYKEELIKRSSTPFLLKWWRLRHDEFKDNCGNWLPNNGNCLFDCGKHLDDTKVRVFDTIYSRESGEDKYHT